MDHADTRQAAPGGRRRPHVGRHRRGLPRPELPARRHGALGSTLVCYALLLLLPLAWALTRTAACTGDCGPTRARAVGVVLAAVPELALALVLSLPVALLLPRLVTAWRPASVGLAAAVIGGAAATVLIGAVTGDPPA